MPLKHVLAAVAVLMSLFVLESARWGVEITRTTVGETPVVHYARAGATGPDVVLAHGFAGSEQMMQGYALPLARAGYRVHAFDFLGHGRNPVPMSGDVTSPEGTTRLLVDQTQAVIDAFAKGSTPVALIGHSMATDILARVADQRSDVGPVVLISAFSDAITADTPRELLLLTGAGEPRLRSFATESLHLVDPDAQEGETATRGNIARRKVVAPWSEHVSILQSRVARAEALAWLNRAYGRSATVTILPTGWAILAALIGTVMLFRPLCARILAGRFAPAPLSPRRLAVVLVLPALVAPVLAVRAETGLLPVLVADYLALHMLIFGALQLLLLWYWRVPFGRLSGMGVLLLLAGCIVFGWMLDRYAANFWPPAARVWIIAAMLAGALPYMLSDAALVAHHGFRGRLLARLSFLGSLGVAVALDLEGLFFLILIAPVMVLFYLVFGTMGRAVSRRVGPLAAGCALALVLAWALGVSFPLFERTALEEAHRDGIRIASQ